LLSAKKAAGTQEKKQGACLVKTTSSKNQFEMQDPPMSTACRAVAFPAIVRQTTAPAERRAKSAQALAKSPASDFPFFIKSAFGKCAHAFCGRSLLR
jgi:hypothetical protein